MTNTPEKSTKSAELRHLRSFVAVARSSNVSRAAEQVGLTQSRVSQQLRELEGALDAALFTRVGKRLALTPAGRRFYVHAVEVLDRLDIAFRSVDGNGDEANHLRIGVVPACTTMFVPAILGLLHERHPSCTAAVDEMSASDIERDLDAGRLDVGLGFLPRASPSLGYTRLLREKFRLVVRRDHPLAAEPSVSMTALATVPLVLLSDRYYMRQIIDHLLVQNRRRPRIQYVLSSVPAAVRTVQEGGTEGLGTLLPPFAVSPAEAPDLVSLPLRGRHAFVEVGLMLPPVQGRNVAVERFSAAAVDVIARRSLGE